MNSSGYEQFRTALNANDVAGVRAILESSPDVRQRVNDPIGDFGARPVQRAAKNPAMMDVLLDFGADINLRSDWANGPFSVLDSSAEEATRHYISRGAILTAHAAARLGWIDELTKLLDASPQVIHEQGGDGQRPLHFAKTPAVVDLLLARGAEIDAQCVDHHSTAAQYALAERPDVCRRLLERGATADIFMPARLGDTELAKRLIDADPSCLAARINAPGYAPVPRFNIYCWTLDWYFSPHEVALKFDHPTTYHLLLDRSPAKIRLLVACSRGDGLEARSLLRDHPDLLSQLSADDHALMPYSMYYQRVDAVKLMLSLGWDTAAHLSAHGIDGGTLLHVAAWHGHAEIVSLLLAQYRDRIDLEQKDPTHDGTPIGWAIHGSKHAWSKGGNHPAVVQQLITAGAKLPDNIYDASPAVRDLLHMHGLPD